MPLAEGQAFDGERFKLFADLVRDIKMGVSVVSAQDRQDVQVAQPLL